MTPSKKELEAFLALAALAYVAMFAIQFGLVCLAAWVYGVLMGKVFEYTVPFWGTVVLIYLVIWAGIVGRAMLKSKEE